MCYVMFDLVFVSYHSLLPVQNYLYVFLNTSTHFSHIPNTHTSHIPSHPHTSHSALGRVDWTLYLKTPSSVQALTRLQ